MLALIRRIFQIYELECKCGLCLSTPNTSIDCQFKLRRGRDDEICNFVHIFNYILVKMLKADKSASYSLETIIFVHLTNYVNWLISKMNLKILHKIDLTSVSNSISSKNLVYQSVIDQITQSDQLYYLLPLLYQIRNFFDRLNIK